MGSLLCLAVCLRPPAANCLNRLALSDWESTVTILAGNELPELLRPVENDTGADCVDAFDTDELLEMLLS